MKICSKETNRCVIMNESDCYKYFSKPVIGKERYYIASRDKNGRILRQEISKSDFMDNECRLVDIQ